MKKILIVEDEEALLFGLKKLFQKSDTSVDVAQTLTEASDLIKKETYTAILTDLRLAGTDPLEGFEVIKLAKAQQTNVKIIVMTAYAETSTRDISLNLGADYFFEKPVSAKKIMELLDSLDAIAPA